MSTYLNLTQDFYDNYQMFGKDYNVLNIVRALDGSLVTDPNTLNEFPELFELEHNFIEVNLEFYEKYNGMVLIPEKLYLFVRQTNDGKYVVEELMRNYFSTIISHELPILKYRLTDLIDLFINLEWKDFDHSNDII